MRLGEIRTGEIRSGKGSLGEACVSEVSPGEVRLREVRTGEVRPGEVRLGEFSPGEVWLYKRSLSLNEFQVTFASLMASWITPFVGCSLTTFYIAYHIGGGG